MMVCEYCDKPIKGKIRKKYHGSQKEKGTCAYKANRDQCRQYYAMDKRVKKAKLKKQGYEADIDMGWLNG